ncbi:hypothetical protein VTN96DRAFT_4308 [Rasamsonia emersonii]
MRFLWVLVSAAWLTTAAAQTQASGAAQTPAAGSAGAAAAAGVGTAGGAAAAGAAGSSAEAAAAAAEMEALAKVMPPCGLKCLAESIPKSSCAPTNQTCICTDPELTAAITLCVQETCTIKESLTTKNVTMTMCHAPVRDRTAAVWVPGIIGGVLAVLAFILRMAARLPRFGGQFGLDDWTMVLVMALVIPLTALSVVLPLHGLGKDIWTVPFDDITYVLYIYFFDESIYLSILPLTKISILFFYLRIFPKKSFRIATYVVMALNVGYLISFVLISVFQCRPLDAAWLRWDGEHPAKCNNINAQGWAAAALNMVLDLLTMSLPLRELSKLSMSLRKKAQVMLMFCVGFFVTIVSVVRLHSMIQFANTENLTWDYVPIGYWSTIEVDVGVICACMPAMRSFLFHLFPSVFESTIRDASASYGVGHSQTGSRLDGKISQKPKDAPDESDFIPLVDVSPSVSHTQKMA